MNILFINHYAGSPEMGMVFRPYYFAKEWIKQGHVVTIIAASFTHIRKKNPDVENDFQEISIDGIRYVWIKTPQYHNIFQRVLNIYAFVSKLNRKAKNIVQRYKPDIVISSSTYNFDIYPAIKIARYAEAKLVYEVRDLWPLTPIELGGYSKYHPFIMAMQKAENVAYRKADSVVSVLPCVHSYMHQHGLDLKRLAIIPNGIPKEDWNKENIKALSNNELSSFIAQEKAKGKIIIGFTGAHGQANALQYLLDSALLVNNRLFTIILLGDGRDKKSLQKYAKDKIIENVFFYSPISKQEIPSFLNLCDILYIGLVAKSLFRFGISPNKIMDYMMAAKPIISAISAGNDLISEAQCGITVEPENPQAIADGILKLAALSEEEREAMGKRGRDYILKNQTYDILAKRFLDFVTRQL
jgi:Glycosyltransferase